MSVTLINVDPAGDDFATTVRLPSSVRPSRTSRFGWLRARNLGWFVATCSAATLLAVGAVAGGVVAGEYVLRDPDPAAAPSDDSTGDPGSGTDGASVESRLAWAQRYGQNRAAMPNLPDVASASPEQRNAATDLLTRTAASTAGYANTETAQAAGYDFAGSLATAQKNPRISKWLARIDSGVITPRPITLRAVNKTAAHDGKVLDPTAPDALIYTYRGHNTWKLVGATFRADQSYPNPPPDPGGPITRWRYGATHPAALTMDVYFVAADDLAHAYALTPPSP